MTEVSVKTLSDLGKRLERLFYFGTFLLLACFIQLYFVSAAVHGGKESPEDITVLISKLEENLDRLKSLYEKSTSSANKPRDDASSNKYLEVRRRLGLSESKAPKEDGDETYGEALLKIAASTSRQSIRKRISDLLGSEKSPETLLAELRSLQRELLKRPVSVWGIETPPVFPLKYGDVSYQVPTSFVAVSLMVALAPLLIGWFGSVYMTRQRELLALRMLRDHRAAFPHVLNVLPVVYESFYRKQGFRNVRAQSISRAITRVVSSLARTFVLLLFLVPMWLICTYSVLKLVISSANASWIEITTALFVVAFLLFQAVLLVIQEWIFLWGKEYYV